MDLQAILQNLILIVAAIITLVGMLAPFIYPVLKWIKNENLRKVAEDWVRYAEEQDSKRKKVDAPALTGSGKYDLAAAGLIKATGISDEKAKVLIESVLGGVRLLNGKK
jgi:hypothetical protein